MSSDPAESVAGAESTPEQRAVQRELIAIGASAGGVEALRGLVAELPLELPASLLVVMHVLPTARSMLPSILARAGKLPATPAQHGERVQRGHIYVAPPDHHLLAIDGRIELSHGPRENGHRPAIDPLFRSVARSYGGRAIGIVLSGTLDDGAAGLQMLRARGAATIAQDPLDALYAGMPQSAIDSGAATHVAKISDMADLVCTLIDTPVESFEGAPDEAGEFEPGPTLDTADPASPRDGDLTPLTCPECGGALWEHQEDELIRFRCHVGHSFTAEAMQSEQGRSLEAALWSALRSLQEREDLFRRMARRSHTTPRTAERFQSRAHDVAAHAEAIRRTIAELGGTPVDDQPAA
jgi:two-component system, chemotaxis family, protein-glutamate methylesterase/glutaminase